MPTDVTAMNVALAEALGLDPTRIRRSGITIKLDSDDGPIVTVDYKTLDESIANDFAGAIVHYKLVPLDDTDNDDEW